MDDYAATQSARVYTIPGKPIPLMRPRAAYTSSRYYDGAHAIRVYDSQKSLKLQAYLNIKSQHFGLPLIDYPVHIDIIFVFAFPKSFNKKAQDFWKDKPYHSRPDVDNLIKWILDVCNKVVYNDDAVVTSVSARKIYGPESMTVFSFQRI